MFIVSDSSAKKSAILTIYIKPYSGAIQCAATCICDQGRITLKVIKKQDIAHVMI
jgi:hypothetical protein